MVRHHTEHSLAVLAADSRVAVRVHPAEYPGRVDQTAHHVAVLLLILHLEHPGVVPACRIQHLPRQAVRVDQARLRPRLQPQMFPCADRVVVCPVDDVLVLRDFLPGLVLHPQIQRVTIQV